MPRTVIHPQFHPRDPDLILYAQDPAPRMWTVRADGSEKTCLYEHGNGEFLVHETFLGEAAAGVKSSSLVFRMPSGPVTFA